MPPRQTWFSQACVDAYRAVNDPGYIRRMLLDRDKGICAVCGVDCQESFRLARRIYLDATHLLRKNFQAGEILYLELKNGIDAAYRAAAGWKVTLMHSWEADHIIPVSEGGGQCGLENYRTLCHPCHTRASAELARRLAERRSANP